MVTANLGSDEVSEVPRLSFSVSQVEVHLGGRNCPVHIRLRTLWHFDTFGTPRRHVHWMRVSPLGALDRYAGIVRRAARVEAPLVRKTPRSLIVTPQVSDLRGDGRVSVAHQVVLFDLPRLAILRVRARVYSIERIIFGACHDHAFT